MPSCASAPAGAQRDPRSGSRRGPHDDWSISPPWLPRPPSAFAALSSACDAAPNPSPAPEAPAPEAWLPSGSAPPPGGPPGTPSVPGPPATVGPPPCCAGRRAFRGQGVVSDRARQAKPCLQPPRDQPARLQAWGSYRRPCQQTASKHPPLVPQHRCTAGPITPPTHIPPPFPPLAPHCLPGLQRLEAFPRLGDMAHVPGLAGSGSLCQALGQPRKVVQRCATLSSSLRAGRHLLLRCSFAGCKLCSVVGGWIGGGRGVCVCV